MKFGICGYGNLGRAVEKRILENGEDELVAIFSRRRDNDSNFGTSIIDYNRANEYQGKIDVMLMCGGSQEDLPCQSPEMLRYFNIIDTFDTHARIKEHKQNLEKISKESGFSAIYSCGWDPGLFSLIRTLIQNVLLVKPQTFWGKGVSQGHSEALRNIKGIADAIQFTIPQTNILEKVKGSPLFIPQEKDKHLRECHIALDGSRGLEEIISEIESTENYFKDQKVIVVVNTLEEIAKMKKDMSHQGIVLGGDGHSDIKIEVHMDENPRFTAQVLLAYAKTLPKLERGVYSILDIPVGLIGKFDNYNNL